MSDKMIVRNLKKRLRLDFLSVSDKYPNDDGCLRRMGEIWVEKSMRLSRIYNMCEEVAEAFGGKFGDDLRIRGTSCTMGCVPRRPALTTSKALFKSITQ